MEKKNNTDLVKLKENLSKQEYPSQVSFVTENTINLIIEKEPQDKIIR